MASARRPILCGALGRGYSPSVEMRASKVVLVVAFALAGCARLTVQETDGVGSTVAKLATRVPLAVMTLGLSELQIACDSGRLSPEECERSKARFAAGIRDGGNNLAAGARLSRPTAASQNPDSPDESSLR